MNRAVFRHISNRIGLSNRKQTTDDTDVTDTVRRGHLFSHPWSPCNPWFMSGYLEFAPAVCGVQKVFGKQPRMQPREPYSPEFSWAEKFRCAFRGIGLGVRGQRSFLVHGVFSVAVVGCAVGFRVTLLEWCILLLCMTVVLSAEMFNSALESLAKAVSDKEHVHLRVALDISSAAVLVAAMGAAIVGTIVFVNRLGIALGWWSNWMHLGMMS